MCYFESDYFESEITLKMTLFTCENDYDSLEPVITCYAIHIVVYAVSIAVVSFSVISLFVMACEKYYDTYFYNIQRTMAFVNCITPDFR